MALRSTTKARLRVCRNVSCLPVVGVVTSHTYGASLQQIGSNKMPFKYGSGPIIWAWPPKATAPFDRQCLDALIRILRGTEDGVRDWLAFGLDPFDAPRLNIRVRLLDAAEAYLCGLAGRLEQHLVQDGVADVALGRQVGDQLTQQVAVPVGLDVGPLAQCVEDAPRDVGS